MNEISNGVNVDVVEYTLIGLYKVKAVDIFLDIQQCVGV